MRESIPHAAPTLRGVLVIVATALAARLITLIILDPVPVVFSGDTLIFLSQRGFGYEPPGYPFFLDLTYPWFGAVGVILLQMIATIGAAVWTAWAFNADRADAEANKATAADAAEDEWLGAA